MLTKAPNSRRSPFFCLLASSFVLSGCSRPPQTAAELQTKLPAQYQGELSLQGETAPHRIVLEPHELAVRDAHTLEFKQVRYQFYTGNSIVGQGDANIRATISTPDLTIQIEEFGGPEGGEALKPGTFQGSLSKNLKEMSATWSSGFDQKVTLKAHSVP